MPIVATPSRRRLAMAALLALAIAGAAIRRYAPDPSTLRDIGTLLLVLWLPAIGNLIAWLIRQLPRRAPQAMELPADFPAGAPFTVHLQVRLEDGDGPAQWPPTLDPAETRCALLVGREAFTARTAQPVAASFAATGDTGVALQLLRPAVALGRLFPGSAFRLVVGTTAVAKGRVVEAMETGPLPAPR